MMFIIFICHQEFPVIEINVHGTANYYLNKLKIMKKREKAISPAVLHGIHFTTLPNPETNFSSFHIVRLLDPRHRKYCVELLVQDSDLYFVAFRVGHRDRPADPWVLDEWFCFSDFKEHLPRFLNVTPLVMNGSHISRYFISPLSHIM